MRKGKLHIFFFILLCLIIIFSITLNEPVIQSEETKTKEMVSWHSGAGNERVKAIKTLIRKFESENSTIKVKSNLIPWFQMLPDQIQIAIAFNTASHLFVTGSFYDKPINYYAVFVSSERF